MSNRLNWIDGLKGFAAFTVVFGHCLTDCLSSKTYPEYVGLITVLKDLVYSFHMPLFFMISGFLFYLSKSYKNYKIKILDFSIVYLIWSFLSWLAKYVMSNSVNHPVTLMDLIQVVYKPIMVYWYLYVLILMYIFASNLKIFEVKEKDVLLCGCISLVIRFLHLNIGILNAFTYHLFFFLMGGYMVHSGFVEKSTKKEVAMLMFFLVINCVLYFVYQPQARFLFIVKSFSIAAIASLMCFAVFSKLDSLKLLNFIGRNALPIYLIHCFFTGGIRILFKYLGVHNVALYFISGVVLGIVVPIVMAKVFERSPILNFVFSPINSLKRLGIVKA